MTQPPSFEPRRRPQRTAKDSSSGKDQPKQRPVSNRSAETERATPQSHSQRSAIRGRRPAAPIRRSVFPTNSQRITSSQQPSGTAQNSGSAMPPSYPPSHTPPSYPPRTSRSGRSTSSSNPRMDASLGKRPVVADHQGNQNLAGARHVAQYSDANTPTSRQSIRTHKPWTVRRIGKIFLVSLVTVLALTFCWGCYLYSYGNSRLNHVAALSGAPASPGTTYLIVGSDERGGTINDATTGMRSDTIMLLHKADNGQTALVSLPRDTLTSYPDGEKGKLNGAFSRGGASHLVATVEGLTGLTVDHYIQIGMDGVKEITDAVGGVELCLDYDVDDEKSKLVWSAGCHLSDGNTALAFSRMRYSDPKGDIGRAERQRQVVSKIIGKALTPSTVLNPIKQKKLVGGVSAVISVDEEDSLIDVGMAGLTLRAVMGADGLKGAPPIADMNYRWGRASTVLLDEGKAAQFWSDLRNGSLTADSFAQL